ncbi:MAG: hypothetical protein B6242_13480 [Anaerolineaceae bacterium 4572_78]|nr:MAG: hypothetical protein B6242_13480 [Anaerolineaceae bacterium 4572_78]
MKIIPKRSLIQIGFLIFIASMLLGSGQVSPPEKSPPNMPTWQNKTNLIYSTFVGGIGNDCFMNCVVAVDAGGSVYLAGYTTSLDFPTAPAHAKMGNGGKADIFLIKLSPDGEQLERTMILGGSESDHVTAIAVDLIGNIYLTGYTDSHDFPTTSEAFQTTYAGGMADSFLMKFNPDGMNVTYATLFGGMDNDQSMAIAVDKDGFVYITGETFSTDLPTTKGSFQTQIKGRDDSFIAKFTPNGDRLSYITYIGGKKSDTGQAIVADEFGSVYITGKTTSADFPTTEQALDTSHNGSGDSFIVRLTPDGRSLAYSSFLGGQSNDKGSAITIDEAGNLYVVGSTLSTDFPITDGSLDNTHNGGYDTFVVKMDTDDNRLIYATLLGGLNGDRGYALAVDKHGNSYITGVTYSSNFPTTSDAFDYHGDEGLGDAFFIKLNETGTRINYGILLGGTHADYGTSIVVDGEGNAYVAGSTSSPSFPTTVRAFDSNYNAEWDAFVTKLSLENDKITTVVAGIVRDVDGNPVEGATITVGANGSTITDENGFYRLIGLETGTYTLTPIKQGYTFSPQRTTIHIEHQDSQNVTLGLRKEISEDQNETLQRVSKKDFGVQDFGVTNSTSELHVFSGVIEPNPTQPFLDLPLDYGNLVINFIRALRDTDEQGRVSSWFDHTYPDYQREYGMTLWEGDSLIDTVKSRSGCFQQRCYDGHNGIDFVRRGYHPTNDNENIEIRAAAHGKVVKIFNQCDLKKVTVSNGAWLESGQTLGIMGSTGNSTGPHLHFGVLKDNGNGIWEGQAKDLPVDPYGWRGNQSDPWVVDQHGPISYYLWKHSLAKEKTFAGRQGTVITDTTNTIKITVPPNAFVGQANIEIFLGTGPASEKSMRSTGYSFSLNLLEWLPNDKDIMQSLMLNEPIHISLNYEEKGIRHLDFSKLTFYHRQDSQHAWQALPTNIDPFNFTITAHAYQLGEFDIQAPLLCEGDSSEPDDNYFMARTIAPDGKLHHRRFDIDDDVDWFQFDVDSPGKYTVHVNSSTEWVEASVYIYDLERGVLLTRQENSGFLDLELNLPHAGTYFVQVSRAEGSMYGCSAKYTLRVEQNMFFSYLPFVVK